jgi:GNAT superfamily N-acetyltransferase
VAVVRPAEPGNVKELAALIEEMDRFYGVAEFEPLDERVRQINDALFADPPAAFAVLAWEGEELVGLASYSFLWPAVGVTRSLYLKELYVAEARRRAGVGRLLMRSVFDIAAKHRCSRVEWATDDFNREAQRFYESLGVERSQGKVSYRVARNSPG